MNITPTYFFEQLKGNSLLTFAVILTVGVILVNGWTDAPNAIATCVVTRCMGIRSAVLMAAVFNFLGVFIMSMVNASVAETIANIVDFGSDTHSAAIALAAALFAIVLWAVLAWAFGIPTSESHALIAGLTGGAVALEGGFGAVNGGEWIKVLYGLVISVVLGFVLGFVICKAVTAVFRNVHRKKTERFFTGAQIFGAACMSFMHGAQDGQKFMGVILLCMAFASGQSTANFEIPVWLMVMCAAVMSIGTSIGGKKIIKSVGMDMVKLEKYQGFSADIASSVSLLLSSVFGIPVSTTHAKTTAIMGVGAVKRLSAVNFSVVKEMCLTWVLTFPGCGLIGFAMTKIFMRVFG